MIPAAVAPKIRTLRKSHGITQAELADISSVSLPSIVRLENGKTTIRLDVLMRVLDSLGYQIDFVPNTQSNPGGAV